MRGTKRTAPALQLTDNSAIASSWIDRRAFQLSVPVRLCFLVPACCCEKFNSVFQFFGFNRATLIKIKVARSFKEIGFNTLYVLIRTTVV